MSRCLLAVVAAAVALAPDSLAWAKTSEQRWIALSKTAMSITGDIVLSPTRLSASGHDFPLEVAADLADYRASVGDVRARVLRVTRKMDPKLLNGNRLGCSHPIKWIVAYQFDKGLLGVDVFDGPELPRADTDAGLCGTYTYTPP